MQSKTRKTEREEKKENVKGNRIQKREGDYERRHEQCREKKKKKTNISLFPQKLLKVLLFRHKVTIRSNKFLSFKSLFIDEYSQIQNQVLHLILDKKKILVYF